MPQRSDSLLQHLHRKNPRQSSQRAAAQYHTRDVEEAWWISSTVFCTCGMSNTSAGGEWRRRGQGIRRWWKRRESRGGWTCANGDARSTPFSSLIQG
jgi:hypothetical protein